MYFNYVCSNKPYITRCGKPYLLLGSHRVSPKQPLPDSQIRHQGSTSDDTFSWQTSSSCCWPTKHATVCVKLTSLSRLMLIAAVSLFESSTTTKSRRTVSIGRSSDSPPTVVPKTDNLSPFPSHD